ncbi:hypothetical protein Tco_0320620 [Tanacetum coccineum]
MGCAWKYLCNLLAAQTGAKTSFSIGFRTDHSTKVLALPAWVVLLSVVSSLLEGLFCFWHPMEITFLMHFFKVLKSGKDFSANLKRKSIQASQLPIEALDLLDFPWGL